MPRKVTTTAASAPAQRRGPPSSGPVSPALRRRATQTGPCSGFRPGPKGNRLGRSGEGLTRKVTRLLGWVSARAARGRGPRGVPPRPHRRSRRRAGRRGRHQCAEDVRPAAHRPRGLRDRRRTRHGKFLDLDVDGMHLVIHLARAGWLRWREQLPAAPPGPARVLWPCGCTSTTGQGSTSPSRGRRRGSRSMSSTILAGPGHRPARAGPARPGLHREVFRAILEAHARTQLKGLLRDQSVIAGIGNAYSDEILHVARMSPFKLAGHARRRRARGAATGDRHDARGRRGALAWAGGADLKGEKKTGMRVHGRTGLPCPVCGDTVREVTFARLLAAVLPDLPDRWQAARRPAHVPPAALRTPREDSPVRYRAGRPPVHVVAHRGASVEAAEHTLAAYRRAVDAGADALECDVRLTADGDLVCVHDRRVDRTSDGRGVVSTLELAELAELDFGPWHDGGRTPTRCSRAPTGADPRRAARARRRRRTAAGAGHRDQAPDPLRRAGRAAARRDCSTGTAGRTRGWAATRRSG